MPRESTSPEGLGKVLWQVVSAQITGSEQNPRWAEHWARRVERERRLEPAAVRQLR